MTLLCKQKALYIKCCIIQNGVPDADNDVLDSTDIKKIFTTFNNQSSFEIFHNEIPVTEVSLLENYISSNDEDIAGTTVPKGSWNAVIRVDNPEIKTKLLNNDFGGVSLNNRVQTRCSEGLSGVIDYKDVKDAECVLPLYISFVEAPANRVGLHVMDYNVYIQKSQKTRTNISGGEKMSLLEEIKAIVRKAEEEEAEAKIIKSESSTKNDAGTEGVKEPVKNDAGTGEAKKIQKAEGEPTANGESSAKEEPVTEEGTEGTVENTLEKEVTMLKEENAMLKEKIAKIEEQLEALAQTNNSIDDEKTSANANTEEPIITKSAKIEVIEKNNDPVKNFYEMTDRDPLTGKKIRKETKIIN